ncbi:MAG: hypothetical protein HZC42_00605 [Candidatus Eisenbacteria bacterium]|nr:hypothetical protein [Candidatus Eisenbacteria bacterium]
MPTSSPAVQLGSTRREAPLPPGAPFYKHLWRGWQRIARAFGNLLSRIVTSFVYVVVVPLFSLGAKGASDPLALRPHPPCWSPLPPVPPGLDEARRGF